jgi:hypothetical protein
VYRSLQGYILIQGVTPLLVHRFSTKAVRELMGGSTRTRAAKRAELKHDVPAEYRESLYYLPKEAVSDYGTLFSFPASAFKAAAMSANAYIVRRGGADQIKAGLTVYDPVPIYGVPKLHITMVRTAGQKQTPDVRTRAVFPIWYAILFFEAVSPPFPEPKVPKDRQAEKLRDDVAIILNAAGAMVGVGEFRPLSKQLASAGGNFGRFRAVAASQSLEDIVQELAGQTVIPSPGQELITAQQRALNAPEPYDDDTAWFYSIYADLTK